jgi:hypothetical protein
MELPHHEAMDFVLAQRLSSLAGRFLLVLEAGPVRLAVLRALPTPLPDAPALWSGRNHRDHANRRPRPLSPSEVARHCPSRDAVTSRSRHRPK